MIVLVSLIVLLRLLAPTIFCMVHPYINIQFCTCIRELVDSLCRDETDAPMA